MHSLPRTFYHKALPFRLHQLLHSRFFRANGLKELFDAVEPARIFFFHFSKRLGYMIKLSLVKLRHFYI